MHCWARYLFVVVVVALGTLSMLGACGQKGPLVLPENVKKQPAKQAPAKPTQDPAKPADVPVPADQVQPLAPTATGNLLAWPVGSND